MSITGQVPIPPILPEEELNARMGQEGKRFGQLSRGNCLTYFSRPSLRSDLSMFVGSN
jgi:hypothetical protein